MVQSRLSESGRKALSWADRLCELSQDVLVLKSMPMKSSFMEAMPIHLFASGTLRHCTASYTSWSKLKERLPDFKTRKSALFGLSSCSRMQVRRFFSRATRKVSWLPGILHTEHWYKLSTIWKLISLASLLMRARVLYMLQESMLESWLFRETKQTGNGYSSHFSGASQMTLKAWSCSMRQN